MTEQMVEPLITLLKKCTRLETLSIKGIYADEYLLKSNSIRDIKQFLKFGPTLKKVDYSDFEILFDEDIEYLPKLEQIAICLNIEDTDSSKMNILLNKYRQTFKVFHVRIFSASSNFNTGYDNYDDFDDYVHNHDYHEYDVNYHNADDQDDDNDDDEHDDDNADDDVNYEDDDDIDDDDDDTNFMAIKPSLEVRKFVECIYQFNNLGNLILKICPCFDPLILIDSLSMIGQNCNKLTNLELDLDHGVFVRSNFCRILKV